jgi:glyoxylase-like metal-dependent hydrolase (beta-lactamase superfamily II)
VLQRAELDALADLNPRLGGLLIQPLRATAQLSLIEGDAGLAEGVRVVATPGHTPGHQSVLVEAADETVAITGDLLVHAVQLVDPAVAYTYESDPERARVSRQELLHELAARGGSWLATPHLTAPFIPAEAATARQ